MGDLHIPGLSLAIIEGDRIVHLRGFGREGPNGTAPAPQTPFFIGSLTKSSTALAMMQLVEDGMVELDAGHKTYRKIHEEIRLAQSSQADQNAEMPSWFRTMMLLPWPSSRLVTAVFAWATRRDPTIPVSMAGTIGITAVGMFGKGHSGWGFEVTRHSLALVVGSTIWKPSIFEGRVEPREILNLTVIFDHDVVDGAPAARFTKRLVELIESGYELDTLEKEMPPVFNTGIKFGYDSRSVQ